MPRNPPWERDELILALDLYFKHHPKLPPSGSHPDVVELSELLNALPIFSGAQRNDNFRNPNGVYMKLANFRSIDPELEGGFPAVGQRDRETWTDFAHDRARLHEHALSIKRNANDPQADVEMAVEEGEEEAAEGKILLRVHRSRERNAALVRKRKARALKEFGRLECEACGFDFRNSYGEIGDGFIECHHTVPVSQLTPDQITRAADLALLCANCHRMIHRPRRMMTVKELRSVFQSRHCPEENNPR